MHINKPRNLPRLLNLQSYISPPVLGAWVSSMVLMAAGACSSGVGQAALQSGSTENSSNLTSAATFTLTPGKAQNRCLTPLGGLSDNGTPLVLGDCDGSSAQSWGRLGDDASMQLTLFDNKCIDVVDGVGQNGTRLQLWDCFAANDNQKWTFQNGVLQWLGTTKCLDVTDGLTQDNNNVMQIWECETGNDHQQWRFVSITKPASPAADGTEKTPAVADANAMSSNTNSVTAPTPMATYTAVDTSTATLLNKRAVQSLASLGTPAQCMTVPSFPSSLKVTVTACDNGATQKFAFDGNGRIGYPSQQGLYAGNNYSKGSYCLSVGTGGSSPAGQPVFIPCNSGDRSQIWAQTGNVIMSLSAKACLTADPNSAADPTSMVLSPCTTRPQSAWTVQSAN